ncbi:32846_t:CDS:2, partial [Racocetra persica]
NSSQYLLSIVFLFGDEFELFLISFNAGILPVFIFPTGEVLVEEQLKDYVDNLQSNKIGNITDERHQAECQAFIVLADTKLKNAL